MSLASKACVLSNDYLLSQSLKLFAPIYVRFPGLRVTAE